MSSVAIEVDMALNGMDRALSGTNHKDAAIEEEMALDLVVIEVATLGLLTEVASLGLPY